MYIQQLLLSGHFVSLFLCNVYKTVNRTSKEKIHTINFEKGTKKEMSQDNVYVYGTGILPFYKIINERLLTTIFF